MYYLRLNACILSLLITFLCSCSLKTSPSVRQENLKPLWIRSEIQRGGNCERGFEKARQHYAYKGYDLLYSDSAPFVLLCFDYGIDVSGSGVANFDGFAVVFSSLLSSTQTAKIISHELGHMVFKKGHGLGIMAPYSELLVFSNGE